MGAQRLVDEAALAATPNHATAIFRTSRAMADVRGPPAEGSSTPMPAVESTGGPR
jgi:hypothetical protein